MMNQDYKQWLLLADVPLRLETDRLILRVPELEDAALFFQHTQESLNTLRQYIRWAVEADTLEKMQAMVRSRRAGFFKREDLFYLVIEKDSGELLGSAGMHVSSPHSPTFELGYSLFNHAIGQGYATEAARALVQLGFEQLGTNRMVIVAQRENARSRAVAERLGFQFELYLRRHEWNVARTRLIDLACYALIRPEFEAQQAEFDVLR